MAGVKGRSGGARPGSGPKPKKAQEQAKLAAADAGSDPAPLPNTEEPLTFLLAVQNSDAIDIRTRVRAAIAAAQYKHMKKGDGGKKEEEAGKAKRAAAGKFAAAPAPRLAAAGGKRL